MFDFSITDSNRRERSFSDVIGLEPVVVSHAVDPVTELLYYQYLHSIGQRVVLINSRDNPVIHIMADCHELALETYTDPDLGLMTHLKKHWSLEPDTGTLARQLRFQMLCVGGEIVEVWRQPLKEHWKHFLQDREAVKSFWKHFGSCGIKWLQKQDKNDSRLWTMPSQYSYGKTMYAPTWDIDLYMKFYKLINNKELEAELNVTSDWDGFYDWHA